jgi:hypothetical protein
MKKTLTILSLLLIMFSCGREHRTKPETRTCNNLPSGIITGMEYSQNYYIIVIEKDKGVKEPAIVSRIMYNDCIIGDTIANY